MKVIHFFYYVHPEIVKGFSPFFGIMWNSSNPRTCICFCVWLHNFLIYVITIMRLLYVDVCNIHTGLDMLMCMQAFKTHTSSEWSPYSSAYGSDPFLHVTLRVGHQQERFVAYTCSILFPCSSWKYNHITLLDLDQQGKMTNTFQKHCASNMWNHTQIPLLQITLLWQQTPSSVNKWVQPMRNVFDNLISYSTPIKYKESATQLCLSFLWVHTAWYQLVWHFSLTF